jgi:hypothetical protein
MAKKSQKRKQTRRVDNHEYALIGAIAIVVAAIFIFSSYGFNIGGMADGTFQVVVTGTAGCTIDQSSTLSATGGTENTTVGGTPLILSNSGNVDLNVTFNASKNNATLFSGTSPAFYWNFSNNEANSATIESGFSTWVGVGTDTIKSITVFQFEASTDTIRVDFNVTVPADESVATKTATITISCSAS